MGKMITIATLFWQANDKSLPFSRDYSPEWVDKLYRGFQRNLTYPFNFVCYTDRDYEFNEPITKIISEGLGKKGYGDCIRPYEMGVPMILVGLDTIITGNCDALAEYCFVDDVPAYPIDPYVPGRVCNGVALVPAGCSHIASEHAGENDMEHIRRYPHKIIDREFPGQVQSYKGYVKKNGIGNTRICYFHGLQKPHQLDGHPILEHWI
jgi:hypothetical protein